MVGETSKSKVLVWAEAQKNSNKKKSPLEILSDATIYGLSSFNVLQETHRNNMDKSFHENNLHYCSDATLFEVGCYLYYFIDLWYLNENEKKRETDFKYLQKQFLSLFQDILKINNLGEIYDNRQHLYGKLLSTNQNSAESVDFYLPQLILRTKDAKTPEIYNFGKDFPVIISDVIGEMFLKIRITGFVKNIMPTCLNNIKTFYSLKFKILSKLF